MLNVWLNNETLHNCTRVILKYDCLGLGILPMPDKIETSNTRVLNFNMDKYIQISTRNWNVVEYWLSLKSWYRNSPVTYTIIINIWMVKLPGHYLLNMYSDGQLRCILANNNSSLFDIVKHCHHVIILSNHTHDDVMKWKHFPRYWSFVRGIHRSPVNSPRKGRWRGALMFSLICVWINGWVNNREAGDLRRYRARYDVNVMIEVITGPPLIPFKIKCNWALLY